MKNWSPSKAAWFTALPVLFPLVYFVLFFVIGAAAASVATAESPLIYLLVFAGFAISALLYFLVIGMYISHMVQNERVDKSTRFAWVIGFVFMSMPILFLYWYKQILKKEEDSVKSEYTS